MKKRVLSMILAMSLLVTSVSTTAHAGQEAKGTESVFTNFVTTQGTKLMDGDEELKFVSLNYPQATSDTPWEQANAVKTIKTMGGNVTRSYTIPVANGSNGEKAYVTGVDSEGNLTFNEDALNTLDNLLAECNKQGIRLIIPLVDHWHWIGGMDGYVWLAGESDGNTPSQTGFQSWAWKFYSSETCKNYFEQMITHLLDRVNSVTGVKYKDDKAVLCWETANEAGGNQTNQQTYDDVLSAWTIEVTNHIKSIDSNHLVLDGRMSMTEQSRQEDNPADILGAHYYEGNYATRCADDTRAAHAAGKPFILGEFGAKITAQPCIDVFQAGVDNDTNGIMMWSLRAHKDGYGYYFHNEDGYWASYHWPGFESGNYYGEKEILRSIYAYAQIANGKAADYGEAKNIAIPAPETEEAPLLYADGEYDNSFKNGSVGDIKWRGVVGGAWYEIQRANGKVTSENAESTSWTTIADETDNVYDSGRNWEDKTHDCIAGYHDETAKDGETYSYRLRACNESGVGLWSNIVTVENAKHVVTDELDLIAVSSTDENPTEIRNTYSSDHSANVTYSSISIVNQSTTAGYIEYESMIPVKAVDATAIAETEEGSEPAIYVSGDGISFDRLNVSHEAGTNLYTAANVSADKNYYYTRIYLAGESKCKLDAISITYQNDGESYRSEAVGAPVGTNVIIQDDTFGMKSAEPLYTYRSENLKNVGSTKIITASDEKEAQILYKTGDDINAYRVVVETKDGIEPVIESSYDGVSYQAVKKLSDAADGDYTRFIYGDLNVQDTVRVVRITFPEGSQDKMALQSVELSSGTKSIPLTDSAPANTFEDGEYYFGDTANLTKSYTVEKDVNSIVYSKEMNGTDFTAYDSIFAWVKPDDSGNTLNIQLDDADGHVWTSKPLTLSGKTGAMQRFSFSDFTCDEEEIQMNLSAITKFAIVITAKNAIGTAEGSVALDAKNLYTGNYGIALNNQFDSAVQTTVYIDSVYAKSSTKVDDFESYSGSTNLLGAAYKRNTGGGTFELSLDSEHKSEGSFGMRIDYNYDGKGYAGAEKTMDMLNLAGYDGFTMYIDSDGSGNDIKVQVTTDVSTFSYTGYMTGKGPMVFYMPFSAIKEEAWAGSGHELDATQNLKSVAIYTDQIGSVTSGTFYVDDLKGANFVTDLEGQTAVSVNYEGGATVTEFPYAISGTAAYVDYVSLTIGDKVFNAPVDADGNWSYDITAESGLYNGADLDVKAGFYYPNKEVIQETDAKKLTLNVAGNDAPDVESYDTVIWDWDFATDGTEGWTFEGFTPWVESGNLVAWTQNEFTGVFSYTITDIPNGTYTLGNDIKVKSNMNNAQMALSSGTDEVKSSPIDTGDVLTNNMFLGKKLEVTDHQITVKYYVSAPTDANGATFAVGDIKLYLAKATDPENPGDEPEVTGPINYVTNGDFTQTQTDWPNLPIGFDSSYTGGEGWSPIKGEAGRLTAYAGAAYTFALRQDITNIPEGIYKLSADMVLNDAADSVVNSIKLGAGEMETEVKEQLNTATDTTVTMENIQVTDGNLTIYVKADVSMKGFSMDNITLVKTGDIASINLIENGDFEELGTEWPNLPIGFEPLMYEGGDGWEPVKGSEGTVVGYADAPYTFTLTKNVSNLAAGNYRLSVDVLLNNAGDCAVNGLTLAAGGQTKTVAQADLNSSEYTTVTIDEVQADTDSMTVTISGDVAKKGFVLDNLVLTRIVSVDAQSPVIEQQPQDGNYLEGDIAVPLTVAAAVTDHGRISYQWYSNTQKNAERAVAIEGATGTSYAPDITMVGTAYYFCKVTNTQEDVSGEKTAEVNSDIATIAVGAKPVVTKVDAVTPTITKQPVGKHYSYKETATVLVYAKVTDAGDISYQWYKNTKNSTTGAIKISGATKSSYTVPTSFIGTTYYFCEVTNTNQKATGVKTASENSSIAQIIVDKADNPLSKAKNSYKKSINSKSFKLNTGVQGTASYTSNAKKVVTVNSKGTVTIKGFGKAVITVKTKGNSKYNAAIRKITVTVVPKKAAVKSAKSKSAKTMVVSWSKDSKSAGYQIEYSTSSSFKNSAKVNIKDNRTIKQTIKKLKSGKKYYVRVRAYKKVGKTNYYGDWSNKKVVKVK